MFADNASGQVFSTIRAGAGWNSLGLSLLASQSAVMFLIVGEYHPAPTPRKALSLTIHEFE